MFHWWFIFTGVPGDCYKLDVDPTDEEDEEPDLNGNGNGQEQPEAHAMEEGHHHIIDDGSLDKLPDDGKSLVSVSIFLPFENLCFLFL